MSIHALLSKMAGFLASGRGTKGRQLLTPFSGYLKGLLRVGRSQGEPYLLFDFDGKLAILCLVNL